MKKLSEVLIERYNLKEIASKFTNSNLSSTETANILYELALKIHKDIMRKDDFYPKEGTAFIDKGYNPPRLMIIEPASELISNYSGDCVAFYCRHNGIGEFARWLDSVRNGSIEILYCPKKGRISSNQEYLDYWNK